MSVVQPVIMQQYVGPVPNGSTTEPILPWLTAYFMSILPPSFPPSGLFSCQQERSGEHRLDRLIVAKLLSPKPRVRRNCVVTSLAIPSPLIDECRELYKGLLVLVITQVVDKTKYWMEFDRIDDLTRWVQKVKGEGDLLRMETKRTSEDWGRVTLGTAGELTQRLEGMHQRDNEYLAFFFGGAGPRTLQSRYVLSRDLVAKDLLTALTDELEVFEQFRVAVACFNEDQAVLENLLRYIQTFAPNRGVDLIRIENLISRMELKDRADCMKSIQECRLSKQELFGMFFKYFTRECSEELDILGRLINDAVACMTRDISQVKEQCHYYSLFEMPFGNPLGGFHLDKVGGLPTQWPIVIQNPFGREHIVLGEEDEWTEDYSIDCFEEAFDLGYLRTSYGGIFITQENWDNYFASISAIEKEQVLRGAGNCLFIKLMYWMRIVDQSTLSAESKSYALEFQYLFPKDKDVFKRWVLTEVVKHRDWFRVFQPLDQYLKLREAALRYSEFMQQYCYGHVLVDIQDRLGELKSLARLLPTTRRSEKELETFL